MIWRLVAVPVRCSGRLVRDPVDLGVPGVRRDIDASEENTLAWQTDALCSQTDPEAFFPRRAARRATPSASAPRAT